MQDPRRARFAETTPMTDEQYEAFHIQASEAYGLETRMQKASERGATLMVKSLVNPNISVPYQEFKKELAQN